MKLFEKTINSTSVFDGRILHITLDDVELEDGKISVYNSDYNMHG